MIRSICRVAAVGAVLFAGSAQGAIEYVTQTRGIAVLVPLVGDSPEPGDLPLNKSTTGTELFDELLALEFEDPFDGDQGSGSAKQRSTLTSAGIQAQGRLQSSGGGSEAAGTRSLIDLSHLQVTADAAYRLSGLFGSNNYLRTPESSHFGPEIVINIRDLDSAGDIFSRVIDGTGDPVKFGGEIDDRIKTLDETLNLPAGNYSLTFDIRLKGFPTGFSDPGSAHLNYEISLTESPTPIPLPPAVFPAIGVMIIGAAKMLRRRRTI